MWYVNSEGDAFNLVDAQSIVNTKHTLGSENKIFAMYFVGEDSLEIESIDDSDVSKKFIGWLAYKTATDESCCCYEDFKELKEKLDSVKAIEVK